MERIHDRAQLVAAIESAAAGGSVLDVKIVEPLVAAKVRAERSPLAALTAREREVLAEIAKGKSNAAIADTLVLTKRAVEKHINSIFLKFNLADAEDVSKRVKATLLLLANADPGPAPDRPRARSERASRAQRTRAVGRGLTAIPVSPAPSPPPRRSPRGACSPRTAAPSLSEAQAE